MRWLVALLGVLLVGAEFEPQMLEFAATIGGALVLVYAMNLEH